MQADKPERAAHLGSHAGWAALVALTAAALAWTEFHDGDLGFHLATGREVLQSGRIPLTNVLSYTHPDFPWTLHQWLPGVWFELAYQRGGALALQSLRALSVAAIWLAVFGAARRAGAAPNAAALGALLGAGASAFRFELRPYLYTHLALALTLMFALSFLSARARGELARSRRQLAGAVLVPVVACHLHAGVIDSWLVLVALAFGCAVEPLRARILRAAPTHSLDAARDVLLALVASIALAALSLAAYREQGARILLFPFDMGTDAYLAEHLVEFRPPYRFPLEPLALYWLLLALGLGTLAARWRSVHGFVPALLVGFALLSLKHVRLVFGFGVVVSPFLAAALLTPMLARMRRGPVVAIALAVAALLLVQRHAGALPRTGFAARTWPEALFRYMERHTLEGHVYASDAWAAPMLGRFYPAHKAFFDNRFEAYPREFYLDGYQHIRYGKPGWDARLDRYDVQIVLMRYTTPTEAAFQGHAPNLRQHLSRDPRWALVAFDDLGELFVRRDGPNAAHAARFAIPGVDPDKPAFVAPPRAAAAGLRRAMQREPRSLRLGLLTAFALRDAGELAEADALVSNLPATAEARALLARLATSAPSR